jgi:hypothetical protein
LVATAGLGDPDSNDAENRFSALFGERIARLTASIWPDAPATARAKLGQNAELANARAAKHSMLLGSDSQRRKSGLPRSAVKFRERMPGFLAK